MKIIRIILIGLVLGCTYYFNTNDGKRFVSRFFISNPNLRQIEITKVIGEVKKLDEEDQSSFSLKIDDVLFENNIINTNANSMLVIKENKRSNFVIVIGEKSIVKIKSILIKSSENTDLKLFELELIKGQLFIQNNEDKNLNIVLKMKTNQFSVEKGEFFFMNDIEHNQLALNLKGTINCNVIDQTKFKLFGENSFISNKNEPFHKEDKSELVSLFKSPPLEINTFHNFGITQNDLTNYLKKLIASLNLESNKNTSINTATAYIVSLEEKYKLLVDDLTKSRNDFVDLKNEIEENKDNLNLDILCIESKLNNCQIKCVKIFEKLNLKIPNNPNDNLETLVNNLKVYRSDSILKLDNLQKEIDAKTARNDQELNQLETLKLKLQTLKQNPENKELLKEIISPEVKK